VSVDERMSVHALVDGSMKPTEASLHALYPTLAYLPLKSGGLSGLGDGDEKSMFSPKRERMHLGLLQKLVEQRKEIRNLMVRRLDDLIVYCDNQILAIGDGVSLKADTQFEGKSPANLWRKSIVDLEKQKAIEEKDFFRDTLFLRSEWMKVKLDYEEQKDLEEMLKGMNSP
jgi:hypothetical protein